VLTTGGPQGQCGTAEEYSSLNKKMDLPTEFKEIKHPIESISEGLPVIYRNITVAIP